VLKSLKVFERWELSLDFGVRKFTVWVGLKGKKNGLLSATMTIMIIMIIVIWRLR
jgi:hypothetical protein